jgi:hypothetical protein
MSKTKTMAAALIAGGFLAGCWATSAAAFERLIDPQTLPPAERAAALHGPLGAVGPDGTPSTPDCRWSRLQMPTSEGVRWMVVEECDGNEFGH